MYAFRRLREREAAAVAIATAIMVTPAEDLISAGTFDEHPPKRRGRRPKPAAEDTPESEVVG